MYLNLKDNEHAWVVDIESDDLDATVIWVACFKNVCTGEELTLTDYNEIREFINGEIEKGGYFIAHNGIWFDFRVLNRIVGSRLPISRMVDTFVLSMLYNPSLPNGHSLDAWGQRLRLPKGDFSDFSRLTDEMIMYCKQDVLITYTLYLRLTERMRNEGFTDFGCEIEHYAWNIVVEQRKAGFHFNYERARELFTQLRGIETDLRNQIYETWPPVLKLIKVYKQAYKADGSETVVYQNHRAKYPHVHVEPDGTYGVYDYVEFNLGSPMQRIEKLTEAGWVPTTFTKKTAKGGGGNPQVDEDSLLAFADKADNEGARLLAKWITINGRANMIGTWMDAYNHKTGAIHGSIFFASTLRYRHSNPNTANIPAVRFGDSGPLLGDDGAFTYEARDLWCTRDPDTRSLVGVDAKGIQLRVLANYLNNPEFTTQLLSGDPHEYNRQLAGIRTRPQAKTFIYAFLLGAGDAKVGTIIGGSTKDGKEVKNRFITNFPGLSQLLDRLKGEKKRTGRIVLCDGTPVLVPSDHMVLGYLLQGDESRIMKMAKRLVNDKIRKEKLDVIWVGDIHDEWQCDVHNDHVERFIKICEWAFKTSGEKFNYNIPIECDAKVGKTWAETH